MIEINRYNSDGSLDKYTNAYDEKGNMIEINRYKDGSILGPITFTYEFDTKGNWIQQVEFFYGIPMSITEREYIYY